MTRDQGQVVDTLARNTGIDVEVIQAIALQRYTQGPELGDQVTRFFG
jgi:hypothetical protein